MKKILTCICLIVCLVLSFSLIACHDDEEQPNVDKGPYPIADNVYISFVVANTDIEVINKDHIADVKLIQDENNSDYWKVRLTLTQEGKELFATASNNFLGKNIDILITDTPPIGKCDLVISPVMSLPVTDGIIFLNANWTYKEAFDLYSIFIVGRASKEFYEKYHEQFGEFPY